jgi:cytochrome c oxidase cbb3-type subunit III
MSVFWTVWVVTLAALTLGTSVFLLIWVPLSRIFTAPDGTTGQVWGPGIRESVRPLPMWWLIVSAVAILSAFTYLALYPGLGGYGGLLGWSSREELHHTTVANEARLSRLMQEFARDPVEQLSQNPTALRMGRRLFEDNCRACHGSTAHGNRLLGAPDLTDSDWLYGGDGEAILASILNGRHGVMPAWGQVFGEAGVEAVAEYVLSLSGAPHDAAKAALGKPRFQVCTACHGPQGKGNQMLGAPNLTDTIWLYGGDLRTVEETIRGGRQGVMPAWGLRLTKEEARVIAAWVYSLSHEKKTESGV